MFRLLVLCVCFVDRCLSLCPCSFGHCVVCLFRFTDSDYPFWYLQTLLSIQCVRNLLNDRHSSAHQCHNDSFTISIKLWIQDTTKGPKQDNQNLEAIQPKDRCIAPRYWLSCLGPLVVLLPDFGYPV
jgi:hypothetical protein